MARWWPGPSSRDRPLVLPLSYRLRLARIPRGPDPGTQDGVHELERAGATRDSDGARIARRLGSRWYAVFVETPRERAGRINPRDAEALQQNVKLAVTLGATVVRVKADKPADGLIAFAQREGVTHVIFGQAARTRWELLWRGSTLDKFLSAVPDAAVQVVPLTES